MTATRTVSRLAAARRRRRIWTGVAVVAFFAVVIDAVIAYWFGTAEVILYGFGNGRTLDCGSIFTPTDAPACAGTGSDDVVGFVVTMVILVLGITTIVVATVQERRGGRP